MFEDKIVVPNRLLSIWLLYSTVGPCMHPKSSRPIDLMFEQNRPFSIFEICIFEFHKPIFVNDPSFNCFWPLLYKRCALSANHFPAGRLVAIEKNATNSTAWN